MTEQDTREKAAAFLDEIREGVAKIIEQPGKGFDFSKYVKEFDKEHNCGTVACMEGWIPAIRPDLAQWKNSPDKTLGRLCVCCQHIYSQLIFSTNEKQ